MFERRLKVFLLLLFAMTGVLALRAADVQIVQRDQWAAEALKQMTWEKGIPTVRGKILDATGREVAFDRPCMDACVDFRALTDPPDKSWVRDVAAARLSLAMGDGFKKSARAKRTEMLDAEVVRVMADIESMWGRLAKLSGMDVAQVKEAREAVVHKVMMRREQVWSRNYERARQKYERRERAPGWRRWLVVEAADAPKPDEFTSEPIEEELSAHPILKAVTVEEQNEIRKHVEQFPGLTLRPGIERYYPYNDAGCHLLGNLSRVMREDLVGPWNVAADELQQYLPNDVIGRTGIEALAEPLLRGWRGRIEMVEGKENPAGRIEPVHGKDVKVTIDIELQHDITQLFAAARVVNEATTPKSYDTVEMHGGAVVIDVETGEVLVLASYPTFDLNQFDERYAAMVADELNFPLLNRATQVAREPGSTVKPVVGLAGIAEGVIGVHDGIECTGFMEVNGKRIPHGKCWTQKMFDVGHHQIPSSEPHVGTHGNPDGFLTFEEAVQRSCNVYFESLGDRLKMDGLSTWYERFGMGRKTGLGISEARGRLPKDWKGPAGDRRFATWISAIGQSSTLATPVQMANVAATIARDGVWVRPRLLKDEQGIQIPNAVGPDRVDLKLPKAAVAAAKKGMHDVVNTRAGSAYQYVRRTDLTIAGKTGTAQASPVLLTVRGKDGKPLLDANGKVVRRELAPSSPLKPNDEAPWYRGWGKEGADLNHSWFIGFAPADKPKIAFAVMLEYGGSGGAGAGLIARDVIDLCVERGYLKVSPNKAPEDDAQPASSSHPAELLEPVVGD